MSCFGRRLLITIVACALTGATASEAQYVPYYGKNKVHYDQLGWRVYETVHFRVYYYPEFEEHLARVVSYLESGYQTISSGLKHELTRPIPAILYKTHTEFEQTNLFPDFMPEGVLAFAEPTRGRLLLPIDEPPDLLQGLITHELTHVFAFDMIPRGMFQPAIPLWIDEGLADYFRATWDPLDVMMLRDAAVTERVPRLSRSDFQPLSGRLVYNMGHAAFEFIEGRWGKEGVRQFLFNVRKGVLGSGFQATAGRDELYQRSFRVSPEEFDQAFDKWLKDRFKPYRDRQRPSDFGYDITPDPEKTSFTQAYAAAASPSGELLAVLTQRASEGELDLVLLSARDGSIVRNLTPRPSSEYESIAMSERFIAGRSISFAPQGDVVAFFARRGKRRSLFLASVLKGHVLRRIPVEVDQAEGPALLPNGRGVVFSGLLGGVQDVFMLDFASGELRNLTNDAYADSDPAVSPDGTLLVYSRRISGHDKLFLLPLADPTKKVQVTFGPYDDEAPTFAPGGKKVYYSSNEDDEIYNLRCVDLETGVVQQYTDSLGGDMAPVVLPGGLRGDRVAWVTFHKGEFRLLRANLDTPRREVEEDVRPAAEGLADFQPDVAHEMLPEKKRRKHRFEGLQMDGRPPVQLGLTSGGDFFGATRLSLTDALGDHDIAFSLLSVRDFQSYDLSYVNRSRRWQFGVNAFDYTQYYFLSAYDIYSSLGREGVLATQRFSGGSFLANYPIDTFRRFELSLGAYRLSQQFDEAAIGRPVAALSGAVIPLSLRFVQETTRFAEFGPLSGSTVAAGLELSPPGNGLISRQIVDLDARAYLRLGHSSSLLAARARGFYSVGEDPAIFYFGGNMELRGFPYLSLAGNRGFFTNAELRVPIVHLAATPIGLIGPVRGVVYAGMGGAWFKGEDFTFSTRQPTLSFVRDPVNGEEVTGLHLVNTRASFGFGLQAFILGYPLHFDWTKYTDLAVTSKGWDFSFWIGLDF